MGKERMKKNRKCQHEQNWIKITMEHFANGSF